MPRKRRLPVSESPPKSDPDVASVLPAAADAEWASTDSIATDIAVQDLVERYSVQPKKVLIAISGGMDSTTLAYLAIKTQISVDLVAFSYGSKHNPYERYAQTLVAGVVGKRIDNIDMKNVFKGVSSHLMQSGGAIPEGHYQATNMRQTVVPGRNLIFVSVLAAYAQSMGLDEVWLGAHDGDHAIYPDCRADWLDAVDRTVELQTEGTVRVRAPFIAMDKVSILPVGLYLGVPYRFTRTCYSDQPTACGKCGSCQERLAAFAANGVEDPIAYQSRTVLPKEDATE